MSPAGHAPFVVIIGPPGVGKSTVAGALAERLGRRVVDSDQLVEEQEGRSIPDIFIDEGEAHFRVAEERAVLDVLTEDGIVLALGGGAPLTPGIGAALGDQRVLFLDVGITDAARRIGFNVSRPLLGVNPRKSWIKAMEERRPTYERLATWRVDTSGRTVDEVVAAAVREIEEGA